MGLHKFVGVLESIGRMCLIFHYVANASLSFCVPEEITDNILSVQEKLFRVAGVPMVENCMAGYNSCMFCYGQVSSLSSSQFWPINSRLFSDVDSIVNKLSTYEVMRS